MTFEDWWHTFGSGIAKLDTEDNEQHARRVAKEAWFLAMLLAVAELERPCDLTDSRRFEVRLREMAERPDGA